jgi:hypothetical protein
MSKAVGWARRSGEWTFPSTLVAGLDLQAFALSRWCAAGSPVAQASGRLPSLTSQSVWPLLRLAVFPPARGFSQPGAPRESQPFALGDSLRRPFMEQAELGTEFFSGQRCRPVGFAFDCVLGWSVATVCRWALGLYRAPGRISAISRLPAFRREVCARPAVLLSSRVYTISRRRAFWVKHSIMRTHA